MSSHAGLESNNKTISPRTLQDVEAILHIIHENQTNIAGWEVSPTTGNVIPKLGLLDRTQMGHEFQFPIKRGRFAPAMDFLHGLLLRSRQGMTPSQHDANHLYEMIDTMGSVR